MPYRQTDTTRATADAKRSAFLGAARSLVSQNGFGAATVAAIARESGNSVGLVYSYFDNRENLLSEVFRSAAGHELDAVKDAVAAAGEDPVAQVAALVDTFAHRALQGRQMAWSLLFEPVTTGIDTERLVFRREYHALGEQIIVRGVAAGVFVVDHVDVAASAVMGAISEALVGSLSPLADQSRSTVTPGEVVTGIRHFCFRALGAPVPGAER
ncbi:TetR/AcrR family transcriptional regulator [Williamsia sp.]|uniref:TetR/AcrR family transcriptional regulator n=1 Tax=Williamsia sp. TaxID=1872085 RepID=UPI001A35A172|nr:TetR/AcrR family transcriptional regulator [Williamsia sp.]MBJ7287391.1 TetR/AcrR family transcriptional regulator [Williamsia sp.]